MKNRKIKLFIEISVIFLFCVLSLSFIFAVNVLSINILTHSKSQIFEEIEKLSGYKIEYDKISPNLVSSLKIYNVKISSEAGVTSKLGNLEIAYSLKSILSKNRDPLSFISKIKLRNFTFDGEKEEIVDMIKRLRSPQKNKTESLTAKPALERLKFLSVELPKGDITIRDGNKTLWVNINNLKVKFDNKINVSSTVKVKLTDDKNLNALFSLFLDGIIRDNDGKINTDFKLYLNKANINRISLKKQILSLKTDGSDIIVDKLLDNTDFKLNFRKSGLSLNFFLDMNLNKSEIRELMTNKKELITTADAGYIPDRLRVKSDVTVDLNDLSADGYIDSYAFFKKLGPIGASELKINAVINNKTFFLNRIELSGREGLGRAHISGIIPFDLKYFSFNLDFDDFMIYSLKIDSLIKLSMRGGDLALESDSLSINDNFITDFKFSGKTDKKRVLRLNTEKPFNGYYVAGEAVYDKRDGFGFNLTHNFDNFSAGKIIQSINTKFKTPIFLNGEIGTALRKGVFTADDSNIKIGDLKNEYANISFNFNRGTITFKDISLLDSKYRGGGSLSAGTTPIKLSLNIGNGSDASFDIKGKFDKNFLSVNVNESLDLFFKPRAQTLSLKADDFVIPVKQAPYSVVCDFSLNLAKKTVEENVVKIRNLKLFNSLPGELETKMSMAGNKISLKEFKYSDGINNITGDIAQELDLSGDIKIKADGFLRDDKKKESYSLSFAYHNKKIDSKIYITHVDLGKFLPNSVKGFANARLRVYGDIKNPEIEFEGDVTEGKLGKSDMKAIFIAKKVSDRINIKKINLNVGEQSVYINDSFVKLSDKSDKEFELKGSLYLKKLGKILKTDYLFNGKFSDFKKDADFSVDLKLGPIVLGYLQNDAPFLIEKFPEIGFKATNKNGYYRLTNTGEKFVDVSLDNNSRFIATLFDKKNKIFDGNISFDNKNINGIVKLDKFPVNIVKKVLYPYVGIENGDLDGTINISGSAKNPEFSGTAKLYYGVVSLPDYLQEEINNITGILIFDKNKILVSNVNGTVRKGQVHGNGEIVFRGLSFEQYRFELNSSQVPARIKKGPVDAVALGEIENFIIEAKNSNFNFIGDFLIDNAEVNINNITKSGKVKSEPQRLPINVILNLKAGKKVKVNYPIIDATVKENEVFILKYVGNEPGIYLGGKLEIEKGNLNYFNKNFKIEQAYIQFYEDEYKINPFVSLKSYYRTRDSKGNNVKIYLTINDRLASFKTDFSSIPYKSQEEIGSLVGVALASNTDTAEIYSSDFKYSTNIDSIVNSTNYFGNAFIFSPLESAVRRITGLDTFSLNTSLFGNVIKSNSGSALLDLLADTNLTFGKYITNEIYFESLMVFKKTEEQEEKPFIPFPYQNYGLNLQLMLQLELPYFSIGYTFLPKDYTNFLNADHKVSFEANFKL
ncbi:MAG TPA: translocation/assembly module TamB domain-containing protein [Spirochaetota bacterium]|nr:MAG: hypothetical protein BWX91_02108 [Spirochaetes bacterium ADurb.Bin133]HNZ27364.1 translocation/assembly module TamB domain-containing protein [Spirochaetota bacterium]HPY87974.1 translocation/assembly module TamB domain-containing protein [Spirochaetota bacterium]